MRFSVEALTGRSFSDLQGELPDQEKLLEDFGGARSSKGKENIRFKKLKKFLSKVVDSDDDVILPKESLEKNNNVPTKQMETEDQDDSVVTGDENDNMEMYRMSQDLVDDSLEGVFMSEGKSSSESQDADQENKLEDQNSVATHSQNKVAELTPPEDDCEFISFLSVTPDTFLGDEELSKFPKNLSENFVILIDVEDSNHDKIFAFIKRAMDKEAVVILFRYLLILDQF